MGKLRVVAVILLLLLTGCKRDERVLEKLGMVQTSSYDLLSGNKLKIVSSVPVIDPDSQVRRELLTAESESIKEARLQLSWQTDLTVVSGQLRDTLFGTTLAQAGIGDYIDTLLRDPSTALGVRVIVVEGDAGELLSKTFKPHSDTGRYINRMLEKESLSNSVPPTTLYEFSRDYNDDGIDAVAPIVKDAGDKVNIAGIALFQKDKYVLKIPVEDGIIFSLFYDDLQQGETTIRLGEQTNGKPAIVMLSSISSKRKIKVHQLGEQRFKVDISATVQGSVLEYTGEEKLNDSGTRYELEQQIEKHITAKAQAMIRQMQDKQVDSLGIGRYVRNSLSYREWTGMDWREVYPQIEVECHVKVTIKDYGKYS
ncbi:MULTISPECIES: Ger(x)C family spore germination protein [unclassified Paenibacillus]|uniref:Ger(x)C family spore germination protein n=1 Tax=unclassified Paenibacillus TaxID=185978 RepID=UPI0024072EBB|nr:MULTISPECIES: Ger(x)C family spore germination protein [unclassified Paenibacillus]MDF9844136.1 spore germination protein [Paenibacillus sp. PastF-2]MDF9850742.1 spore germination protein [Paenibacillus sp. PastM-2]MDF9857312.1 spore germination protein [Paenibacillus sp. PastF-1]MDH6482580.1 spore germination protein [Paenibacillus sp. PastH-2]MDH6510007.1 spore germination protein [Paenibacillus sp. PastM-3]